MRRLLAVTAAVAVLSVAGAVSQAVAGDATPIPCSVDGTPVVIEGMPWNSPPYRVRFSGSGDRVSNPFPLEEGLVVFEWHAGPSFTAALIDTADGGTYALLAGDASGAGQSATRVHAGRYLLSVSHKAGTGWVVLIK